VTSADEAAARAGRFGGSVVADPFDVSDSGRMAVLADPAGAAICVWQARAHIGARLLNSPGALCWTELVTPNLESAEDFYTGLFGWTARRRRTWDYVELFRDHELIAGILGRRDADSVAHWLPYFAVEDLDDTVEVARRHAATAVSRSANIPMAGRFAVLRDPLGATFGVYGVNEAA
jgi:predicted enzyme related to lactoylglutathione lyase